MLLAFNVIHWNDYDFRFESHVDERYKEFCRNQGKAEDVSGILDF